MKFEQERKNYLLQRKKLIKIEDSRFNLKLNVLARLQLHTIIMTGCRDVVEGIRGYTPYTF